MTRMDVRWQQRLSNFERALGQLTGAVELSKARELSQLEKQGVIQAFEFTHELAWNVLKDFFVDQGNQEIKGSKDATREAFKVQMIRDGENWMAMIRSRNKSSHTYDEALAEELVQVITKIYHPLFEEFLLEMKKYLQ